MAWIELHDTVKQHRKTFALAKALKIPNAHAVGLLACLWTWCATYAEDGNLTPFPVSAISDAAGWNKSADAFCKALQTCGWLDIVDGGYRIHDWGTYSEFLQIAKDTQREKTRTRVQRYRDKNKKGRKSGEDSNCNVVDNVQCNASCNVRSNVTCNESNVTTIPNRTLTTTTSGARAEENGPSEIYSPDRKYAIDFYTQEVCRGVPPSPSIMRQIGDYVDELGADVVCYGLAQSIKQCGAERPSWSYCEKKLLDWSARGISSLSDAEAAEKEWEKLKTHKKGTPYQPVSDPESVWNKPLTRRPASGDPAP